MEYWQILFQSAVCYIIKPATHTEKIMNSRERVLDALKHKSTDRVPLAMSCHGPNSAIDALTAHFGVTDSVFGGSEYVSCDIFIPAARSEAYSRSD